MPSSAITAAEIVAREQRRERAPSRRPGAEETPPPRRTTNATIGASRYSASSPPSHGSGLLARRASLLSARRPTCAGPSARSTPCPRSRLQRVEPVLLQRVAALRVQQVAHERRRARRVRRAVEDRHRVVGVLVDRREADGRELRRGRLDGVEEAGVELARLQAPDERRLGIDREARRAPPRAPGRAACARRFRRLRRSGRPSGRASDRSARRGCRARSAPGTTACLRRSCLPNELFGLYASISGEAANVVYQETQLPLAEPSSALSAAAAALTNTSPLAHAALDLARRLRSSRRRSR